MSVEDNKTQTRQIIDQGWNKGNMEALDRLIAPNFVNHTPGNPNETRDDFKQRIRMVRSAFPDWVLTVEDMLAERDCVVTRWRAHGTHLGSFRGIAPTGKRVEVTGIAVDRVIAGARVEGWVQWDILGLLQQLGAKLVVE